MEKFKVLDEHLYASLFSRLMDAIEAQGGNPLCFENEVFAFRSQSRAVSFEFKPLSYRVWWNKRPMARARFNTIPYPDQFRGIIDQCCWSLKELYEFQVEFASGDLEWDLHKLIRARSLSEAQAKVRRELSVYYGDKTVTVGADAWRLHDDTVYYRLVSIKPLLNLDNFLWMRGII